VAGALRGRRWIQSTSTCRGPETLMPWIQQLSNGETQTGRAAI
jgi:hypothetical protein